MHFSLGLDTRRIHLRGITTIPVGKWATRQARSLSSVLAERDHPTEVSIRDRQGSVTATFDEVLREEAIRTIRTPIRFSRTNAFGERFIGAVLRECPDRMLVFHRRQLEQVPAESIGHDGEHRTHRSLVQRASLDVGKKSVPTNETDPARLWRRDKLGDLIHGCRLAA